MTGLREYCRWETFRASCPVDEVIVIRSALYGRMRSGRCLMTAQDGGSHVGCKAYVIREADRLCSGRRTCEVQLPEPTFDVVQTSCPRGLSVYLEVIYECLPGKSHHLFIIHVCSHKQFRRRKRNTRLEEETNTLSNRRCNGQTLNGLGVRRRPKNSWNRSLEKEME